MTDVPYDYWDSSINSFGPEHEVLLFIMEMESIGVQAKYVNLDGTVTKSEIATYYTSGNISVEHSEVVRTEWYDLTGRRLGEPSEGLMIRKDIYPDGSMTTRKVIQKMSIF